MFQKILQDKYLKIVFGINALFFLGASAFSLIKFSGMTGPIIIHYDIYKGIDVVGDRMAVFGILISVLIIIGINFFLTNFIYSRERFLSYVISFVTMLISIFALIAVVAIGLVN